MLLLDLIGNTPLIQLSSQIYAKLETPNPSGSIKDRMVGYLVKGAIAEGTLIPGKTTLVEASSGNTGISLAMLGANMGCGVIIIMPKNMSDERKKMMTYFGAQIVEVGDNAFLDAIKARDNMLRDNPSWWSPLQFSNPSNISCHYETTGPEIAGQLPLDDKFCAFIHGAGTGGTIMGIKKYFDENQPALSPRYMLVSPKEPAHIHGIQGINDGQDFLADRSSLDGVIEVSTNDAIDRAQLLGRHTGLMVGISSGANIVACEKFIKENDVRGYVVTMLCDRGERYLSLY